MNLSRLHSVGERRIIMKYILTELDKNSTWREFDQVWQKYFGQTYFPKDEEYDEEHRENDVVKGDDIVTFYNRIEVFEDDGVDETIILDNKDMCNHRITDDEARSILNDSIYDLYVDDNNNYYIISRHDIYRENWEIASKLISDIESWLFEQKKIIICHDGTPKKYFNHDEQEIALAEMEKLAKEEEDGVFELAIYIAGEFIETVDEIHIRYEVNTSEGENIFHEYEDAIEYREECQQNDDIDSVDITKILEYDSGTILSYGI